MPSYMNVRVWIYGSLLRAKVYFKIMLGL